MMRRGILSFSAAILFFSIPNSCAPTPKAAVISNEMALKKISFSVDEIDGNGLIGPPDGKRLVAYKFVIPATEKMRRKVHRIDRSVKFFDRSSNGQYDCIGEGATKEMLLKLARLSFIKRIEPFYAE